MDQDVKVARDNVVAALTEAKIAVRCSVVFLSAISQKDMHQQIPALKSVALTLENVISKLQALTLMLLLIAVFDKLYVLIIKFQIVAMC
jgi:hypothetical protein